jgi:hypothetical protein
MNDKPTRTDSVRVWSGFRRSAMTQSDFLAALGDTFVPGTLTMLKPFGISAYIVAALVDDDPDLPGESALVVYSSPDHYRAVTRDNLRGRVHRASHFAVFDMDRSRAVFPTAWDPANTTADTFHLYARDVDWQTSRVFFTIVTRAAGSSASVAEAVRAAAGSLIGALDGIQCQQSIIVLREGFATVWTAFAQAKPPTVDRVQNSIGGSLPSTVAVKKMLPAETLACYGEDAELMVVRRDAAIQFRFLRGATTEMY